MLTEMQFKGMVYARENWFIEIAEYEIKRLLANMSNENVVNNYDTYLKSMPEANLTVLQVVSEEYIAEYTAKIRYGTLERIWLDDISDRHTFDKAHSSIRPWLGMRPTETKGAFLYERAVNIDITRSFNVALGTLVEQSNRHVERFNIAIEFAEMAADGKFDREPTCGQYTSSFMERQAKFLDNAGIVEYAKMMRNSAVVSIKLTPSTMRFVGFKPVWVLSDIYTEVLDLSQIKSVFDRVQIIVTPTCIVKELRLPKFAYVDYEDQEQYCKPIFIGYCKEA